MRTCPSSRTACYADVCKTWPCDSADQIAALLAESAAHAATLRPVAMPPIEPAFPVEDDTPESFNVEP